MTTTTSRAAPSRTRRGGRQVPVLVAVPAAIAAAFFALPLIGLAWRVPWSDVLDTIATGEVRDSLILSLVTSTCAATIALALGVPLAWMLARAQLPGRSLLRALCLLSMVLPPVVAGVALFSALGRNGLLGRHLDEWFGVTLPFSPTGAVLAQTFVAMPFLVLTVESALRSADWQVADAARTLGATRTAVFWRVTLPQIRPALVAGVLLAWARALGEFGATITFAGNLPGRTTTVPLQTYLLMQRDPDGALVLSLVLVAVSFAILLGLRDRWLGGVTPRREVTPR